MENFLSGGTAELEAAKRAVIDEAEKHKAAQEASGALKAKEKELNAKKMFMSDKIDSTIKNRRSDLEKDHDSKIRDAEKDLKEARKNKKDALSRAVDNRIKLETADLAAENKKLKRENKDLFKANKVPGFCNTNLYYSLFVPRTGKDFAVFALSIVIAAALIPNVVCALIEWKLIFKIILYVAIVVFFALIYFLITIWTKSGNKADVLEQARPNMKAVRMNKKSMKKLERGIKKDGDEAQYGLSSFDAEIERRQAIFDGKKKDKENALAEFDQVTSAQLKARIEDEIVPEIEDLTAQQQELEKALAQADAQAQQASEHLASQYIIYLGEKNITCEKIDELISIINDGRAADIAGALEILKGGRAAGGSRENKETE